MRIKANYDLKSHNSFQLSAKSRYYVEVNSPQDILTLREDKRFNLLPWFVLGLGTNVLLSKDLEFVVIHCVNNKIQLVKEDEMHQWYLVDAGMDWQTLVDFAADKNLWGLENLAGIPSSVGAASVQNIGAYGAEACDLITRVKAIDLIDGSIKVFRNIDCDFCYRHSIFKDIKNTNLLIYQVVFKLKKFETGQPNLSNSQVQTLVDTIKQKQKLTDDELTPNLIKNAVLKIRAAKLPDYKITPNAGSFFKNPIIDNQCFNVLNKQFPEIISYPFNEVSKKLSAAWLIEKSGWKGFKHKSASVSDKHALILLNDAEFYNNAEEACNSQNLVELYKMIQQDVDKKFGVILEQEVCIV